MSSISEAFKALKVYSSEIDDGMKTLDEYLRNPSLLIPSPGNAPKSLGLLEGYLDETKKLAGLSAMLENELKKMAEVVQTDTDNAIEAIQQMEQDFSAMEDALQQYGYQTFCEMNNVQLDTATNSNSDMFMNEDDGSFPSDCDGEMEEKNRFPASEDASYLDVEITPGLECRVKRSYIRDHAEDGFFNESIIRQASVPTHKGTRLTVSRHHLHPSSAWSTPINHGKASTALSASLTSPVLAKKRMLEKPKSPVLSKETYEALGIEPPPVFYEQLEHGASA